MRNKLNIRSVQLVFSVIMLLTFAGLTGCQDRESELLEKELVQEKTEESENKEQENSLQKTSGTGTAELPSSAPQQTSPETIYVDVCGAVVNPGVYELSSDSRVFQAIEKAGGYLPEAAAGYLNRAKNLSDGQQIYVPTQEEVDSQAIPAMQEGNGTGTDDGRENSQTAGNAHWPASDVTGESAAGSRINLNTADVSQLTTLTGVGESKALAIIAYREENGPFTSVEDIMNVPGIKEGTYEKIKDKIAIE